MDLLVDPNDAGEWESVPCTRCRAQALGNGLEERWNAEWQFDQSKAVIKVLRDEIATFVLIDVIFKDEIGQLLAFHVLARHVKLLGPCGFLRWAAALRNISGELFSNTIGHGIDKRVISCCSATFGDGAQFFCQGPNHYGWNYHKGHQIKGETTRYFGYCGCT